MGILSCKHLVLWGKDSFSCVCCEQADFLKCLVVNLNSTCTCCVTSFFRNSSFNKTMPVHLLFSCSEKLGFVSQNTQWQQCWQHWSRMGLHIYVRWCFLTLTLHRYMYNSTCAQNLYDVHSLWSIQSSIHNAYITHHTCTSHVFFIQQPWSLDSILISHTYFSTLPSINTMSDANKSALHAYMFIHCC